MLIGTAGHIDHGKTTLVRALTGVDTDRLPEEKARGISIELGYAYAPLPNGERFGMVDVPGHERLVRTMIAGACGIDFALLAIAADDGIMPQTREHLEILDLLCVARGAVAITKIDRAAAAQIHAVREQALAALASTTLSAVPVFEVNATVAEDAGLARLRRHIYQSAADGATLESAAARRPERLFRLAIDRVFTLAGHGTIVTGTAFSGRVRVGDCLTLMPSGRSVRVRSIHAHGRPSDSGHAGQRCALNLAGIKPEAIARGNWLADPRALIATTRLDTRLRLLPDRDLGLRPWSAVHFHCGAAHALARAVPLLPEAAAAGIPALVQFVFGEPQCVVPGDRFIVRDAQAARTLGGGVVLDPTAPARRRRTAERLRYLDALERMIGGAGLEPVLECAPAGASLNELARLTNTAPERIGLPAEALAIDAEQQRLILHRAAREQLRAGALDNLRAFHAQLPEEPGPDLARLRRMAAPSTPLALWRALIEELVQEHAIERNAPWLHLPGHVATLSADDRSLLQRIEPLLAAGRFDPPWVRELAASLHEPEERVRSVLRRPLTNGVLHQVVRDLFYDDASVRAMAEIAAALAGAHGAVDAAAFRDALGVGRKRAIQILEFFDRVGYLRRVCDRHLLRQDSGWAGTAALPPASRKAPVPGGAPGLQTQEGASDASW